MFTPIEPKMPMQPRVVSKHEMTDYMVLMLEDPQIDTDRPYAVITDSKIDELGYGVTNLRFETQVEAIQHLNVEVDTWINWRLENEAALKLSDAILKSQGVLKDDVNLG
jgi:hypothetical protein